MAPVYTAYIPTTGMCMYSSTDRGWLVSGRVAADVGFKVNFDIRTYII
jgi:hypothetical protein